MKKYEVVKDNKLFNDIIQKGKKIENKYFIINYQPNNLNISRFGIAVGKKIGNAVVRNRVKRIIRMIITENKKVFKKETDYIIIMKKASLNVSYKDLENSLKELVNNEKK